MIVIPPMPINEAELIQCSIPEIDVSASESAWNAAADYAEKAVVVYQKVRYECIVAGVHSSPPTEAPDRWLVLRPSNRWAMFRHLTNDATEGISPLTFTLKPGKRFDALFLRGVQADQVDVELKAGSAVIRTYTQKLNARSTRTWSDYFFGDFPQIATVLLHDLPPYGGAEIKVTLTRNGGRKVRLEHAGVGRSVRLGHAEWGPRNDALGFSVIDRDEWGGIKLTQVKSVPALSLRVRANPIDINRILAVRAELDASPALWAATDGDNISPWAEATSIFGVYRRFPIDISNVKQAFIPLELESM